MCARIFQLLKERGNVRDDHVIMLFQCSSECDAGFLIIAGGCDLHKKINVKSPFVIV